MRGFAFFHNLQAFMADGVFHPSLGNAEKADIRRVVDNFLMKDGRLFYIGPKKQYMRMVVMSDEEKRAVLTECHNAPGTGNHLRQRGTRDRAVAGYYWSTLTEDVAAWVKCCHQCQPNDPIKTQVPVMRPIKVNEPFDVVGLDLVGPLMETPRGHKYVMTMTDLFTKWVVAEPLKEKSASEVASALVQKMYTYGMVRKIITDQSREFVNELNGSIFQMLNIKHSVTSANHPQSNGQDERTNQNLKRALRKYVNEGHDDWDLHLPAVVYGINTAVQASTKHSPFYLMFHRHPRLPEVLNACERGDPFEVANPEDTIDATVSKVKELNDKVLNNIQRAQNRQKKQCEARKRKVQTLSSWSPQWKGKFPFEKKEKPPVEPGSGRASVCLDRLEVETTESGNKEGGPKERTYGGKEERTERNVKCAQVSVTLE